MVGYEPDLNPPPTDWGKLLQETIEKARLVELGLLPTPSPPPTRPMPKAYEPNPEPEVDYGYMGVLATPLIQIFSVRISDVFDEGIPCQIYGSIRVESHHQRFLLYDHDPEDCEPIVNEGSLSLVGPHDGAIIHSMSPTLDFCLKDRIRGVELINGKLDLDVDADDTYDRLLTGVVRGRHGVAHVYYVVFRHAIYATLQVIVTKNHNDDSKCCNVADIWGSIVAVYENEKDELNCLEMQVFQKPSHKPFQVPLGTPINLSRNVVVVPAYSSFTIKLNLWDSGGKIADGCLDYPANDKGGHPLLIRTEYACVQVTVDWDNAYFYLYRDRGKICGNMQSKVKPRASNNQHLSAIYRSVPWTLDTSDNGIGHHGVEVFSVFVCGINQTISALCGTILINDGSDVFSIFNQDKSCPELLREHNLACIEVNYRAINNVEFGITLNLNDPVNNLEVSRGELSWHIGNLQSVMPVRNKQLCSVIRGKDGYAAVHYEIFEYAVEALVEVKLYSDGDHQIPMHLFGNLFARYSHRPYSSSYDRKYFTSRLFDCLRENSVEVNWGSKTRLLKSFVVVPAYSSLIIEANLEAFGINNVDETISGMKEFKINMGATAMEAIQGEHYWIHVYVTFKAHL